MRGIEPEQPVLFSYVNLESRVPRDHPLRTIKPLVDSALKQLSPRFDAMLSSDTKFYAVGGHEDLRSHLVRNSRFFRGQ